MDSYRSKSKEVQTLGWAKIGINVIIQRKTSPEEQFSELWTEPGGGLGGQGGSDAVWAGSQPGALWCRVWEGAAASPPGSGESHCSLTACQNTACNVWDCHLQSLFYANHFLQMFWNVLTVLVWFSKTLDGVIWGNCSRSCSSETTQDLPGHPAATGYGEANSCLSQENKIRWKMGPAVGQEHPFWLYLFHTEKGISILYKTLPFWTDFSNQARRKGQHFYKPECF